MILQTSRLTLRPLRREDAASMHDLMSDAEVMAFWDVAEIEDFELTDRIVATHLSTMALGASFAWAMLRSADQAFVGCCDLSEVDGWHRRAEIGFITGKAFWGDGYTFEAMQAVIDHAAQDLRLKRLAARVQLGNLRSIRLLEKLGFEQEGVLRGHVERAGQRRDCLMFGLLL